MIDLHSHILPRVDDGAESLADALEMVKQLKEAGFEQIVATPHTLENYGEVDLTAREIGAGVKRLQLEFDKAGVDVRIHPGAEAYIFPEMGKEWEAGRLQTIGGGKYLLIELPSRDIPNYAAQVFFDLQVRGITPILAHPERYPLLFAGKREKTRLLEWAENGVLFQLDIRSLGGRYGAGPLQNAHELIAGNFIHFIGSDIHRPSRRPEGLKEELEVLRGLVGDARYMEITETNPLAVLENGEIKKGPYHIGENRNKAERAGIRSLIHRLFAREKRHQV